MAITVGNTSNGKITSAGLTLTISHTVASGSKRLLLATVGYYDVSTTLTVSATYNGIAMTVVSGTSQNIGTARQHVTFYLKNPPVGTADIVFTFGANSTAVGCGIDISGVNLDDNLTFDAVATAAGASLSSNTVSPASNTTYEADFVYASSLLGNESIIQSPSDSQTEIVDDSVAVLSLAVGYKTSVGNVTPIGWTFSSSNYRLHAFSVRAAGVAVVPVSEDTFLAQNNATTNFNTNMNINIGEANTATNATARSLVKPNFSSLPSGVRLTSATLKVTPVGDLSSNDRTMYAHRILRSVVYNQTTWNIYSTGNNWGTAGCSNSTTDYDGAVVIGSMSQPASPTLNVEMSMNLSAAEIQKFYDGTYTNNGLVLFVDTQLDDLIQYASTNNATEAYRPRFVVKYRIPSSSGKMMFWF